MFKYCRIIDSLGVFLDSLDLATTNGSSNDSTFTFNTFAVKIQEISPDSFFGQTFLADLGSVEQAMTNHCSGNKYQ